MKIVVTSDTHIPSKSKQLPERLLKECESADLIIHAGDWSSLDVYQTLSGYAQVIGVFGNIDDEHVTKKLNETEIVKVKGFKIGVVHGHGEKKTTEKRALEAFEGEGADIIIFGHSHIPMIRYFNQVLLMNPGSPTDKRRVPFYSYGIIRIGETINPEIVLFK